MTLSEPNGPHKLGFWKSEEFSKFAIVASYVLRGRIPKSAYKCFTLLTKIHHLIFSKQLRINGWTKNHIELLERLLWKHAIQYESIYGISACTENVEYSLHMAEDVRHHSTLDNNWCYLYERLVKFYKHQTTNMKSMCKTFSDRAHQLHFAESYLELHEEPQVMYNICLMNFYKSQYFCMRKLSPKQFP